MKIGILTYHQAINFGAVLQLYALSNYIENVTKDGTKVYAIKYEDSNMDNKNKLLSNDGVKDFLRSIIYFRQQKKKRNQFNKFKNNYINFTPKIKKIQEESFDILIVGSDQVWNTDINAYNKTYVFEGLLNTKKTSYAASVGKSDLNNQDRTYFISLNNFDAISVREDSSKKYLKKVNNMSVHVNIDPTLLLSKKEWLNLIPINKENDEKYILVYKLQNNSVLDNTVNRLITKTGLPVKYVMPHGETIFKRASNKFAIGPIEFLKLIANSEYVVTNSFHGTCFSILFEKKFITIPHKTRGARMIELLEKLGLEYRLQYLDQEFESIFQMINLKNFDDANRKLKVLRIESQNYINNNIIN